MKREKKNAVPTDETGPLTLSLGALLGREKAATDEARKEPPPPAPVSGSKRGTLPGRVILARETKGRGGKTVTALSFGEGVPSDLEGLAKELRTALGCGGTVEGDRVVLQGDQIERASAWFAKKGVRVTRGS
jgi:translation initiation factor 1